MEDGQQDTASARSGNSTAVAQPKKWWQWILVYPTFVIALVGAVPTFKELYESRSRDVDFGTSKIAEMRNEMWRKNMTCGMAPMDPLINDFNVAVDATICKSGDVLIRVTTPAKKQFFEWVSIDAIFSANISDTAAINLFSSAMADQFDYQDEWPEDQWPDYDSDFEPEDSHSGALSQYYGPVVLCQNWINNVLFVRRVSYPNQGCFDETINTFTGQVLNVSPAPCYC
ncbi:MAG: hypothetical protein P8N12_02765 [Porticoccaceae bacterium]|nr:hypothetical protein [Porticoccaceae bacterium]